MSNEEKRLPSTNINCLIAIYLKTSINPYFIGDYKNLDNVCFI